MRILLLGSLLLLGGCAFTVHDVEVGYQYGGPGGQSLSGYAISVGEIRDIRGEANPRMMFHMQNQYGDTTTGGWQAERPLADIVRSALVEGLAAHGVRPPEAGSGLALSGELVSYDYDGIMGFWSSTVIGRITVQLQIVETGTGRIIWRDLVVGSTQLPGRRGVIEEAFSGALDDLVNQLVTDEYFLQQVRASRHAN